MSDLRLGPTSRTETQPAIAVEAEPEPRGRRVSAARVVGTGLSAGVLSGMLGVGGGIVMVPLFVLFWKMPQREAHATSLMAIIPISIVGITVFGSAGKIRFSDGIPLAIGAVVGARVGSSALSRVDENVLKAGFAALLLLSAILLAIRG